MLDQDAFNEIVALLLPHMGDPASRKAWVERALFGCSVLNRIDWLGNAQTFTSTLVSLLNSFGECEPSRPALVMLLETLKGDVGMNYHARIDRLIAHLLSASLNPSIPTQTLAPSTQAHTTMTHVPIHRDRTILVALIGAVAAIVAAIITVVPRILNSGIPTSTPTPTLSALISTPATPSVEALRDLDILDGPGAGFSRLNVLPLGSTLDIMGISDDRLWYQVLLLDGTTGWILASESGARFNGNRSVLHVIVPTLPPTSTLTHTLIPTWTLTVTDNPTPLATPSQTDTPSPTATITATLTTTPTLEPTNTSLPPTSIATNTQIQPVGAYPCDAVVVSQTGANRLNVVRSQPGGRIVTSLTVNKTVRIIAAQEIDDIDWYQVVDTSDVIMGWVDGIYLRLSATCP